MSLTATLGTGLDATSNPDPNSLSTKAPYTTATALGGGLLIPSANWVTQGNEALFPLGKQNEGGDLPIKVHFVPSAGSATTYTVTMWIFNPVSGTWSKPKTDPSNSYTGEAVDFIYNPGKDAIFLQLSSISSGTISIYFDPSNAEAK